MRFLTDQAVEQIAALQDVDAAGRVEAFADADAIYHYLNRSYGQREEPVPEDALRKWAEQQGLGPDRVNVALEVLKETGRVVALA